MATRIRVPIRVLVDDEALLNEGRLVTDASRDALSRALRTSVVARAGTGISSRAVLRSPTFTWTGSGLASLEPTDRSALELALATTIAELSMEFGIVGGGSSSADVHQPLADPPIERLDLDRLIDVLDLYNVPAYDDKGRKRPARVRRRDADAVLPPALAWRRIRDRAVAFRAADAALDNDPGGHQGVIFALGATTWQVLVSPDYVPDGLQLQLHNLTSSRLRRSGGRSHFASEATRLPPAATYRLRWYALASDTEAVRNFYRPIVEQALRHELIAHPPPETMSRQDVEDAIAAKIELGLNQVTRGLSDRAIAFLALEVSGIDPFLIGIPQDISHDLDVSLLPLTVVTERSTAGRGTGKGRRARGTGEGTGTGTGTGAGAGAPGGRAGAGQGAGQGAGEGQQSGAGEGRGEGEGSGGLILGVPGTDPGTGRMYPPVAGQPGAPLVCASFEGEPRLAELGTVGEVLRARITRIAGKLAIEQCDFAGAFCLNAASALHARVQQIGAYAATEHGGTEVPVATDEGNLGLLEFHPTASPAVQFLRVLAGICSDITALARDISEVYQANPRLLQEWADRPIAWVLRFDIALADLMRWAVAELFGQGCRVLLLQLLRSSATGIQARLDHFEVVAPLFERMVWRELTKIEDLVRLRDQLQAAMPSSMGAAIGRAAYSSWREARRGLQRALEGRDPTGDERVEAGGIVRLQRFGETESVVVGIRDSFGTTWTLDRLERAIALRRGSVEEVDPLFKQVVDLEGEMERFRADPTSVRPRLRRLLTDMAENNRDIQRKVEDSWEFAFRASQIQESIPGATVPYTSYVLRGIHLQTHQALGEFFLGDRWYGEGINALFGAELGRQSLNAFFEFTGLVLLAVLCPPAAVVAGMATAVHAYANALEKEEIYQSLLDPELVLSSAEVEVEMFAAHLGLVLSFVPEVGTVLRGASTTVRVVARRGARQGATVLGRLALRSYNRALATQLRHGLALAFAKEAATNEVMDLVVSKALEPIMAQLEREAAIHGSIGGSEGARDFLQRLDDEAAAAARPRESGR